jgi:drug/metabolite transporter (DMT)-like permease
MKLSNQQYDIAKRIITVVIPAFIALLTALGGIYKFDPSTIIGTISALTVFAGVVLGISSNNYAKTQEEAENKQGEQ